MALSCIFLAILLPLAAYAHIRVDVPVGGEELVAGETFEIMWDANQYHGPGTIGIEFSADGGAEYTVILSGIPLNSADETMGSYVWTAPEVTSADCRIRAYYDVADSVQFYEGESPAFIVKRYAGDVNVDGGLDAVDVQLVINAILGLDVGGLNADVNDDSTTNAQDIQLVINGALGVTK